MGPTNRDQGLKCVRLIWVVVVKRQGRREFLCGLFVFSHPILPLILQESGFVSCISHHIVDL